MNTSPVAAIKSSAIEIGTSGLVDPPVDAPIVLVGGRVTVAPPTLAPFGVGVGVGVGLNCGEPDSGLPTVEEP